MAAIPGVTIPRVLSESEKRVLKAANGVRQATHALNIIHEHTVGGARFELRPSLLRELNRLAIDMLHPDAGKFRTGGIGIDMTDHKPPEARTVETFVNQLCEYANKPSHDPIHAAAWVMWRLNWIHPFPDGNGRTSRMASYVVMSIRLGMTLPGSITVPTLINNNKPPYYAALEAADAAWKENRIDLTALESLIIGHLETQLASVPGSK